VLDTKPDPRQPRVVREIAADELDRGEQFFGYDGWWHLNHDTRVTSEFATPSMFESGLDPEDLLGRKFGHHLNLWSLSERRLVQRMPAGTTASTPTGWAPGWPSWTPTPAAAGCRWPRPSPAPRWQPPAPDCDHGAG
jgi:56kDa selenium binding protein (SBP56)